jgi:hypothetical protein
VKGTGPSWFDYSIKRFRRGHSPHPRNLVLDEREPDLMCNVVESVLTSKASPACRAIGASNFESYVANRSLGGAVPVEALSASPYLLRALHAAGLR